MGDNGDLYSLFSIPIVGVICGVFLFIFKRYKKRILLRVLTCLFDWIDGGDVDNNLPNTTSTSADTTLVKTRLSEENLSLCQSLSLSTHSDSVVLTNRIFTDAEKIYNNIKNTDVRVSSDEHSNPDSRCTINNNNSHMRDSSAEDSVPESMYSTNKNKSDMRVSSAEHSDPEPIGV